METLLSFILAVSALAITPGPDNIYVLMQSLANGKQYGLATVAGLMAGCLVHTTLVAFGVSTIIQQNETLFFAIKLLGALYLIYLAYKVFKSPDEFSLDGESVQKKSLGELFKQGFIMNVLNPKVTLFFLALFPGFLFSKTMSDVLQFFVLGFLFILVSGVVFSTIALLSGSISEYIKRNNNFGKFMKWLQIVVFVGIAIFILI